MEKFPENYERDSIGYNYIYEMDDALLEDYIKFVMISNKDTYDKLKEVLESEVKRRGL